MSLNVNAICCFWFFCCKCLCPSEFKGLVAFILFDSIYLYISFALKGAGDTRLVSLMAFILPWPLMVLPATLVIDQDNAVIVAWRFVILYVVVLTSVLTLRFKKGRWKEMSVI